MALVKAVNLNEQLRAHGSALRSAGFEGDQPAAGRDLRRQPPRQSGHAAAKPRAAATAHRRAAASRACGSHARETVSAPAERRVRRAAEPTSVPAASPQPAATAAAPQPPEQSFEEKFGTRWTVWIGGAALALGGIFLVKYSIEAGLIGPGLRVFFGALLAAALIAAGEWTRRKEQITGVAGLPPRMCRASSLRPAPPSLSRPSMRPMRFTASWSASAFVLLGIVALATLAAALLHGPALAALGLVGAYVTPLLVSTGQPNYWALYIYLAVVTGRGLGARAHADVAVARDHRGRLQLLPGRCRASQHRGRCACATPLPRASRALRWWPRPWCRACSTAPSPCPARSIRCRRARSRPICSARCCWCWRAADDAAALTVFTLLIVATLRDRVAHGVGRGAAPVAAVFAGIVIIRWALAPQVDLLIAPAGAGQGCRAAALAIRRRCRISRWALASRRCSAVPGYLAQGRTTCPVASDAVERRRRRWCRCHAGRALLPHHRLRALDPVRRAWRSGLAGAQRLRHRDSSASAIRRRRSSRLGALHAAGTVAALALALTFSLDKGWLTVALALMVPGIAWIANERPLPMLRWLAAAAAPC